MLSSSPSWSIHDTINFTFIAKSIFILNPPFLKSQLPFFMCHHWISCRNAPLSAPLKQGPIPQGVPCCCRSLRRALNGARGSSQSISLLLSAIPGLIHHHTRLSLCLHPSPCHQLPCTGDLLTVPDQLLPQCSHWGTRAGAAWCSLLSAPFPLSCLISNPLPFPVTHTWVSLTCLSGDLFKLHGIDAKSTP